MTDADAIARLNAALEGRYRVERELGEGGMATVYLANDLKHDRKVALKVLKPALSAVVGADRFLAEIKTTANLQHPHILPLFDSGEAGGFLFYVMPFVEGESLRERLARERQLPVDEAVQIAKNVAEALDYAHRQSVIHRDIKPANILLQDGKPVVSDFGIALALGAAGAGRLTETGLSLGTPHYMSPEQATGDPGVGPPTDIYALGCVTYEMLVGEPPYTGATPQAILGRIVTGEAEPAARRRRSVPRHVDAAIQRALEKVPADRFTSARTFAAALADPLFGSVARSRSEAQPQASGGWKRATFAFATAAFTLLVTTLWSWAGRTVSEQGDAVRLPLVLPPDQQLYLHYWSPPVALAPDGMLVAYVAAGRGTSALFLRPLNGFETKLLQGTEGAHSPFFAPDGRWVGYYADGKLWKVAVDGGAPPVPLSDVVDDRLGAAWGPDGMIFFADVPGLMKVSAGGGTADLVLAYTSDDAGSFFAFPQALPDGRVLLTALDPVESHVEVFDPDTREVRPVLEGGVGARYMPTGHILFGRSGTTYAVAFDLKTLSVGSSPVPLSDPVLMGAIRDPLVGVSSSGTLAYVPSGTAVHSAAGTQPGTLVRVSRYGLESPLWETWPGAGRVRLSPDGRFAADYAPADATEPSNFHVWVFDLARHVPLKLTTQGTNIYPVWAPDGGQLAFSSMRGGPMSLYSIPADGSAEPEPVRILDGEQAAHQWLADGRLVYTQREAATGTDVWLLPIDEDQAPQPLLRTSANEMEAAVSPDGRWIAYASDASGRFEIYVRPFPGPGGQTIVSNTGGRAPRWAPDGGELFYREGDRMWAVTYREEDGFEPGRPELLFEGPYVREYDVDPDGSFVMVRVDPATQGSRIHLVLNFFGELNRLAPTN